MFFFQGFCIQCRPLGGISGGLWHGVWGGGGGGGAGWAQQGEGTWQEEEEEATKGESGDFMELILIF